ncbi:MAG: sugar ABC transporter permease [Spirochaetales bacterium]
MRKGRVSVAPYLFLLPNTIIFAVFIIIPAIYNFYLSMFDTSPFRPHEFVGLGNFLYLLKNDDLFLRALKNLSIFVLGDVGGILVFSVIIGLLLNQKVILRGVFRSAFFYPVLLSPVVVALVWQWILNNQFGALNALLNQLGMKSVPWLLVPHWSRFWAIFVHLWATLGFYSLIVLAGLQSIPAELYEAATVDGADRKQQFFFITFPLLFPTLMTVVVLSTIRGFEIFDHVYILTGGGPGTATLMVVQYIYRAAFQMDQFGLAAAASFFLFLVIFSLTLFQYLLGKRKEAI